MINDFDDLRRKGYSVQEIRTMQNTGATHTAIRARAFGGVTIRTAHGVRLEPGTEVVIENPWRDHATIAPEQGDLASNYVRVVIDGTGKEDVVSLGFIVPRSVYYTPFAAAAEPELDAETEVNNGAI